MFKIIKSEPSFFTKAEFTIDIFQLGRNKDDPLSRQRKEIADSLEHIKNLSLDEVYDIFGNEFYSFIKAIYPKINKIGVTKWPYPKNSSKK